MPPSSTPYVTLASAVATRDAAIAAANDEFDAFARSLEALIPYELQGFAQNMSWINRGVPQLPGLPRAWLLPGWLEHLAKSGLSQEKIRRGELRDYGFRSYADAERKLRLLLPAWSPHILRIRLDRKDRGKLCIWFYTNPPPEKPR